jgi:tight adherence protein B
MSALVLGTVGIAVTLSLARAARRAPARVRVRRLARRRAALPPRLARPLEEALARADLALGADEAARVLALAALVAALVAGSLNPTLAAPAAVAVVVGAVVALLMARGRADRRVGDAVPAALDRVSAQLRAGGTVGESLAQQADAGGALAADLRRVQARVRLGAGLTDALEQWPRERPLPPVRVAAGALAVAAGVGGPAAHALESLAESLRAGAAAIGDAQALSAQARASAVVVGAAPIGYLAFAAVADPGSVSVLVGTGAGRLCLVAGLGLEVLAALWMRTLLGGTSW